ncbi:MAG: hypothetical protein KUG65_11210 [Sphingomonadaceae bacterium]|nr:hypothetical protein [Sphingomonadaceae bacterium]
MKANFPPARALALSAIFALVSSCSETHVEPSPTLQPAPKPAPAPEAPPEAPRPKIDWREAPITPGDWTWSAASGQSVASFAGGLFEMRCDKTASTITLLRRGRLRASETQTRVPISVITASVTRPLSGTGISTPSPYLTAQLAARDPLLDAMAFSRGRFAVEVSGLPTLYVPSWPEVSRVIEDCR